MLDIIATFPSNVSLLGSFILSIQYFVISPNFLYHSLIHNLSIVQTFSISHQYIIYYKYTLSFSVIDRVLIIIVHTFCIGYGYCIYH